MLFEKTFYFLRHGQTDWNAKGLMQGSTDIPLNDAGRDQADAVRPHLDGLGIMSMCASPMSRAHETAQIAGADLDCPMTTIHDLREFSMGERDGTPFGPWFFQWRAGNLHIEGAETRREFLDRAIVGLNEALEQPGPVLMVSHGGLFGAIKHYAGLDDSLMVKNCELVCLEPPLSPGADWRCGFLNQQGVTNAA